MRFLFCATPGSGHVEPMVPLMRALLRRGHALAWAAAADTHARMQALGVQQCFEVGGNAAAGRAQMLRRWPPSVHSMPPGPPQMNRQGFPLLFGGVHGPEMLQPLVDAIRAWAPQLVVNETAALAAPLACEITGCRQVTHGFGMPPPDELLQAAAEMFAPSWLAATGHAPPADAGLLRHLYLDIYPPLLQPPERVRTLRCQRLRPTEPTSAADTPLPATVVARLGHLADRPLVYLTFGTVVNGAQALRTAAAALAGLPVRVVLTVGRDGEVNVLDSLPENVHVERFIAQAQLLPHCSAVVSHGGSGTVLAALAHGLPQLVLPQGADQFVNAAALEAGGAGIALLGQDATARRILEAVQRLLQEPGFRERAVCVAQDIAAMPAADEVARVLEGVAQASRVTPGSASTH